MKPVYKRKATAKVQVGFTAELTLEIKVDFYL